MQLSFLNWLLAISPVIVILILMLGFRWGGSQAGGVAWFITIGLAMLRFGAGPELIAYSQVKSMLLSLDVLYIIWAALLFFHVANEAGAVNSIGNMLTSLTTDRTLQGLLVGWVFVSFLQGVGGFGVPVAVTAPFLVSMGFNPITAVIMTSLGHGWAVNFGSMGTSYQSMMAVTNLSGEYLAPMSAILLGSVSFPSALMVAFLAGGWRGMIRNLPYIAIIGTVMGAVQYWMATHGMWTLGATVGSLAGLLASLALLQIPFFKGDHNPGAQAPASLAPTGKAISYTMMFTPYIILLVVAFASNLIPSVAKALDVLMLSFKFPQISTAFGHISAADQRTLSLFGHPGFMLVFSSVAAGLVYRAKGFYKPDVAQRIWQLMLKSAAKSSLGILAMMGMAILMTHAGMTNLLAEGISQSVPQMLYPMVAPFIGALGAFITGSNNNSNVLFAVLQMKNAELLGLGTPLILASQTTGGSIGSIIAPAKNIVGCSTVGLSNQEGVVLAKSLVYGLLLLLFVALQTMLFAWLGWGHV